MEVTFECKCIVLIFFQIIADGRSAMVHHGKDSITLRHKIVSNAQEDIALHWPKGIVTYYMDNLIYDNLIAQRLRMAMNVLESASCVRFKPTLIKPSGNSTWVHFTNPRAERNCVHEPIFKNSGEIVLVLGLDCLRERDILHTLLHAIGFKDEVTHPQRDQYIRVMWNNIQPEFRHLYRVRSSDEMPSTLLVEYDPLSIMHFHDRAFSMNGHATVMPLVPGLLISPSDDLSQLDKMRLRLLFDHECNKRKVGDMIEACKMILKDSVKPGSTENVTNDTNLNSEEKKEKAESDKEGNDDKINAVDAIGEVESKKLNSIENNYDLNEFDLGYESEKLNSNKVLYQKKKDSAEDHENAGKSEMEYDD